MKKEGVCMDKYPKALYSESELLDIIGGRMICPYCGKFMKLRGYFPEPEVYPEPLSNWVCPCGAVETVHHFGVKIKG